MHIKAVAYPFDKNNIVKYYCNLKKMFSILVYFKVEFIKSMLETVYCLIFLGLCDIYVIFFNFIFLKIIKIEGMAYFFYCKLIGCSKVGVSFRNEHWQLEGVVKDVTLMPKPSNWCHQRRPIILEGRSIFRYGLKIMKTNYFFCGLNCSPQK